jgi:phosphoribosylformimino-5-aminoimidazole carboxamide ribotide isomerase
VQIIPVIDLKGGQVVRGIAGRRAEYQPIKSRLVATCAPCDVAAAFLGLGLQTIYLADLDAIAGADPNWRVYSALLDIGARLVVDAGVASVRAAERLAEFRCCGAMLAGIVAALETVPSPESARQIAAAIGSDWLVFSLDLTGRRMMTSTAAWQRFTPLSCAAWVLDAQIRRLIVLDVAAVGVGSGPTTLDLCREIRRHDRAAEIISGGGIRGREDLGLLEEAGCDAALVASALHDGRLSVGDAFRPSQSAAPSAALRQSRGQ